MAMSDLFEVCSHNWQDAVNRRDFHEAILVAITGYLYYRDKRNEQIAAGCLNLIYVAISQLLQMETHNAAFNSCSFCGRSASEVRLGAGPDAYIRSDCVEIFHKTLA